MEGKRLANDLVALGVPVKLIADSAVDSLISKVNLVLVGADSVFKDGSLIHKIGTKHIAVAAKGYEIPLYSACEAMKFSALDFLGGQPDIPQDIFDATRAECVSDFITEEGTLEPNMVEGRIREMLKEIYS
jgi:translation initiation factor 2B subunit (eIF-2B alpha/beta/delta family)